MESVHLQMAQQAFFIALVKTLMRDGTISKVAARTALQSAARMIGEDPDEDTAAAHIALERLEAALGLDKLP